MDEVEPGTKPGVDTRRRSNHHRHENLERDLLVGEIDETMTDLIFGEAASEQAVARSRP